ncbi:TonB-dependent receptor, partial [Herbaspirillum sp. HC18]
MIRPILFASACSAALMAAPVYAQSAANPSGEALPQDSQKDAGAAPADGADIVVTGSRAIRDGSQAPTPVTVMAAEDLAKAQPGLIGEALNQLPSFRGSTRPAGAFTGAVGPQSGSYLNLRNLGVQRTLV